MLLAGNDWGPLAEALRSVTGPSLPVSVVVPAHGRQEALDACLAALSVQSYPASLLEVVVVDDASPEPLRLPERRPERTTLVRVPEERTAGNGGARRTGAEHATGDVVLFVDSDLVCDRGHVASHARWHHLREDVVVLSNRRFAEVPAPAPERVADAVQEDRLWDLADGADLEDHDWVVRHVERSDRLRAAGYDAWLPVVGAGVSVHRSLYDAAGGFPAVDRRGVVDTLFGFRAWTAGGVVVPDPDAWCLHLGRRTLAADGARLKPLRAPALASLLPDHRFRPSVAGRAWEVPLVRVAVEAEGCDFDQVRVTVDSLLSGTATDLAVTVHRLVGEPLRQAREYWGAESRVRLAEAAATPLRAHPSPYGLLVGAGWAFGPQAVARLLTTLATRGHGLVRVVHRDSVVCELWSTRAWHRAAAGTRDGVPSLEAVRAGFGETAVAASSAELGLVVAPALRADGPAALLTPKPATAPAAMEPLEPVEPIEPIEPAEPVEPVEPVDPIEPVEPDPPAPGLRADGSGRSGPGPLRLTAYRLRRRLLGR